MKWEAALTYRVYENEDGEKKACPIRKMTIHGEWIYTQELNVVCMPRQKQWRCTVYSIPNEPKYVWEPLERKPLKRVREGSFSVDELTVFLRKFLGDKALNAVNDMLTVEAEKKD